MKKVLVLLILLKFSALFSQVDTSGIPFKGQILITITKNTKDLVKDQILSIVHNGQSDNYSMLSINGDFDSIPYFVFYLNNIEGIDIHSTKPISISEAFNQFKRLSSIVCFSTVTGISGKLKLDSLKNLSILFYKSNVFPKVVCDFRSLQSLELKNGTITILPNEILKLSQLKILTLTSNKISEIPSGIDTLRNLEVLGMCSNQLKKLPDRICLIPNLRQIWISGNKGLVISEEIKKCLATLPNFDKIY
jgi:Leucine-rich repeat (LRR) protein